MTLRRLAGDTLIYGTGYILGKVLNYLLGTVYLTWKFEGEQDQYGLFTEMYFYVAVLLVILTLRMETTFFRFGSKDATHKKAFDHAATALMGTAAIWVAVLMMFRSDIANALQYPDMVQHITILGFIIALDVLVAIPFASLRLEHKPIRFAVLRLAGIMINILAILFFFEVLPPLAADGVEWAYNIYDPRNRLLYVFIANLLGSLFVFLIFIPKFVKIRFSLDKAYMKRMLTYTWPLIIVGVAGVINQSGYIVFLKAVLPGNLKENLAEGGVYSAAARIALLMSLFITAFNYAAEPFFFNQSKEANARETYARVATAFTAAGTILMLAILMYLDLIQLVIGTTYREGMYVVPILLLAFLMLGLYYNFAIWYKLSDKTHYGAYISSIGALITLVVSFALIPTIGKEGSAWAALACYGFMSGACYLLGKRHYPIPYQIGEIIQLILLAMGAYGISVFFENAMEPRYGLQLILNTGLLLGFILIIWVKERQNLFGAG